MKSFFAILCITAIFGAAIYLTLDVFRPGYPLARTITNQEGKELEVIILGKTKDDLYVERTSDHESFKIPINTLVVKDRFFSMRLKPHIPPPPPPPEEPPPKEIADPYIKNRLQVIDELQERKAIIEREINSRTLSELLHQNRIEQQAKVDKEIRALQLAIETYKYRNRVK